MSQLNLRKGFAFAAALLLVGAAIVAAVALRGSGSTNASANVTHFAKGDPDAKASLKNTPGEGNNAIRAEQEAFDMRAFPADDVPWQAQQAALKSFMKVNAKFQAAVTASSIFGQLNGGGASVGKFTPGSWQPTGSFSANYPDTLTFFGKPYVTSGRTTAMAISPSCTQQKCQLWIGAAGGGVWRTNNALAEPPGQSWQFVSGSFGSGNIGYLTYSNGVLYAGTGETHACGDCGAGMGVWKSTDAGQTWLALPAVTHTNSTADGVYDGNAFAGRAISSIAVDPLNPKSIWVGSGRAVRGIQSTTAGATSNPPLPRPPFGLYHSNDGGQTFQFVWDGNGTIRGITRFALDPSNSQIMYASAYSQGLWRSMNGGSTWTLLKAPLLSQAVDNAVRTEFGVVKNGGQTRIYLQDGASGPDAGEPPSQVWRIDDASGSPVLTNLTNSQNQNLCGGQCWYDQFVTTVPGNPDMAYIGGSFDYGTFGYSSNGRGVLLSRDAGASWTDMTADADESAPNPDGYSFAGAGIDPSRNAMHPDQHVMVLNPSNPGQFFEGDDGGVIRSSGAFTDISSECASRGLGPTSTALCQQLLSWVPTKLTSLNRGLNTLQYTSVWVDSTNPNHVQGGTQDNGTFENYGPSNGNPTVTPQILYGDGGNGGIRTGNPTWRVGSFYGQAHDANVDNGDPTQWYIIGGDIANSPESSLFYPPVLADPNANASQTIFEGSQSVWRTQDFGGDPATLKANCPEFFHSSSDPACGDFQKLGATTLTTSALGTKSGGNVDYIARAPQDTSTAWASTNAGRVFISQNVDNPTASAVTFTRVDNLGNGPAVTPGRSVSAIAVDPTNALRAFVVYNGYNFNTPSQPGHVFSVTYNPAGPSATWTNLDNNIGDLPANSVAYDAVKDDLYVSNDFGVMRLPRANASWTMAGSGLPVVQVPDLKIMPGVRKLYAATHGMGLWTMPLPGN